MAKTILCTLGPASLDPQIIKRLDDDGTPVVSDTISKVEAGDKELSI